MKIAFLTVLLLCGASAFAAPKINLAKLPLRADAPILFVPKDWKIEKTIVGDLNKDRLPDSALVLVEANKPAKDAEGFPTDRKRALLVLLREGKGFKRAGFNDQILLGTRDGGAFWGVVETPVEIEIARGALNIGAETGSREVTSTTHRFRFDARQNRFFLIGFDAITRDRASGELSSYSANYLTGRAIHKTGRIDSDKDKITKSRVSRVLRPLESLREDDRFLAP